LQKNAIFIKITEQGIKENNPHDLMVI